MLSIAIGAACGFAGALPGLLLARRARQGAPCSVALGLATIVGSFSLTTVALGVAYLGFGAVFPAFSGATMATFLGLWSVEALIAWRWMREAPSEEVSA